MGLGVRFRLDLSEGEYEGEKARWSHESADAMQMSLEGSRSGLQLTLDESDGSAERIHI